MSVTVSTRSRALLFAAISMASSGAAAHGAPSDEAVWFFLTALLAIPVFLIGVILLIVHLIQHAKRSSRARRAASAGQTSDAANVSTERGSAGTLAAWMIGGSVALLAMVALAGVFSTRAISSFWRVLAVLFVVAALIIWAVRYASRRSREARAQRTLRASQPQTAPLPVEAEEVFEPPAKSSNAALWLSIVFLAIAGIAALSPFYLMHRKDVAARQAEAVRAAQKADEAQRELDRAAEAASNKARIDQMAREMMGEPPLPAPRPPPMTAEQKALAKRAADEQRIHCNFYGVFNVEKRGVPYQFTMRADGTFESVSKIDKSVRAGKWSYSTEPNRAGDSHTLIFKYSVGLPATEEERLTQTGSKRVSTQNSAGRYDYELLEALEYPECNDPVRKREYPKRSA